MNEITSMYPQPLVTMVVMCLAGLLIAFYGYRIKKIAFSIIWFMFGYTLTQNLITILNPNMSSLVIFALPILIGLFLAIAGVKIENLCISLGVGAAAFYIAYTNLLPNIGLTHFWTIIIAIIIAVMAGSFAVWAVKPCIVIFTGIYGASLFVNNLITYLAQHISLSSIIASAQAIFIITAILAASAIIFQLKNTKNIA